MKDNDKQTREALLARIQALEEELRVTADRNSFLEKIIDGLDDPIFAKDSGHRWVLLNKASCDVMGHPREELIGKSDYDLFPKEQADIFWEKDEEVLRSGEMNVNEEAITWHGKLHTISTKKSLLEDPDSGDKYVVGTIRDITERICAEERFSLAASLGSDIIWEWDLETDRIDWYGNVDGLLGMGPGEFGRDIQSFLDIIHPDDRARLMEGIEKHRDYSKPIDSRYRVVTKSGEFRHWMDRALPVTDTEGNPLKWIGVCSDITDQVVAEAALSESESRFRYLFETSPIAIWEEDFSKAKDFLESIALPEGESLENHLGNHPEDLMAAASRVIILDANRATQITFQAADKNEFIDKYPTFFSTEMLPEFIHFICNVLGGRLNNWGVECVVNTATGEQITVNLSWSVAPGHESDYSRLWFFAIDITERQELENTLRQHRENLETLVAERTSELERAMDLLVHSQKMEAVGQLAGGIAHEFNNILATICGTAELLLNRNTIPDEDIPKIQRIMKSGGRAKDLTMKLLTFARKEKLNIRTVPADRLVGDVVDMLKGSISKKTLIRVNQPDTAPRIDADANQIVQALLNICINACDSMPDGGTLSIEISTREISKAPETDTDLPPGAYSSIRISDTGTGMDGRTQDRIFEPFFTTKESGKGSGLGLSVSHGIIENHGGDIVVTSTQGKGSVFEVLLPVSGSPEYQEEQSGTAAARPAVRANVMVVDDDMDFLETVADTLEFDGFNVVTASRGSDALKILKNIDLPIDVIILDIMMPETDGSELFDRIKEITPDTGVAICSGFSMEGVAGEIMKKGADAFIQKPFDSDELVRVITGLLQENGS